MVSAWGKVAVALATVALPYAALRVREWMEPHSEDPPELLPEDDVLQVDRPAMLDPSRAVAGELRLTRCEMRGEVVQTQRRRGTRGSGVKILGGEEVVESNIHAAVYSKLLDHAYKLGDELSDSQLYSYAIGVAKVEGLRLVTSGGSVVEHGKEQLPLRLVARVAHHAVYSDCETHDAIAKIRQDVRRNTYIRRWEEYDVRAHNRTAMSLLARLRLHLALVRMRLGLGAPLPPRQ